jgi:hypothetical protein
MALFGTASFLPRLPAAPLIYNFGSVLLVRAARGRGPLLPPRNSKWVGSKVRVCRPSRRAACTRSISLAESSVTGIQTAGVIPG